MKLPKLLLTHTLAGTLFLSGATMLLAEDKEKSPVSNLVKADDVAGSELWDFHGNQIGTIEQVLLEPSGKGVFVVVDAGKMLEDDRRIAIPWRKVYVKTKEGTSDKIIYTLDVTKEKLKGAPTYKAGSDADLSHPATANSVYRYWGIEMDPDEPVVRKTTRKTSAEE